LFIVIQRGRNHRVIGSISMNIRLGKPERRKTGTPTRRRAFLTLIGSLLTILAVGYFGISAVMADRLSQAMRIPLTHTPADFGLAYERVRFASAVDNIRLEGWYVDSPGSKVILLLHGKDGTRESGDAAMPLARAFAQNGYDVFMFDFRGHGESDGNRFSVGQLEVRDVAGALNYLKGRGITEVGTLGFSMGAATALNAAPDHPELRAIVADSSFADLNLILETELPKASGLPPIFNPGVLFMVHTLYGMDLPNNIPAHAVARLGSRPVLLIHGGSDDLVPVSHAYMLQKAGANDPNLQMWIVPNAGHTRAFEHTPEEYLRRVIAFFDQNMK